eukprot:PhM_4_TR18335/c0_g1_i1/m.1693
MSTTKPPAYNATADPTNSTTPAPLIDSPSSWSTFSDVWFNITIFSIAVCGCIYCAFGFLSIRRRVFEDVRFLFVPVLYGLFGIAGSFVSVAVIATAIGTAYVSQEETMSTVELIVYVSSYVITFLYYSSGS